MQTDLGLPGEKDAFDTLFGHGPDTLEKVKRSLLSFSNKYLNRINLEVGNFGVLWINLGIWLDIVAFLLCDFMISFFVSHPQSGNYVQVTDLETQFQDGVFLVLLMGLLEGYFVPLYSFHLQVSSFEQKVPSRDMAFSLTFFYVQCDEDTLLYLRILNTSFQVANVAFAFMLMQEAGLPKPRARPEGYHFVICMYLSYYHQKHVK